MPGQSVFMLHSNLLSRSYWCSQAHREGQFDDLLQKMLFLDSIALSANVEALITDEDTYEDLVETTGPGAQSLVDLLHAVCLRVICTPVIFT